MTEIKQKSLSEWQQLCKVWSAVPLLFGASDHKKVILNSIVGVSLNEYNKRHTVVVAEKSVLKSVSIGNSCLHGSLVRGFQIGVLA